MVLSETTLSQGDGSGRAGSLLACGENCFTEGLYSVIWPEALAGFPLLDQDLQMTTVSTITPLTCPGCYMILRDLCVCL